MSVTDEHSDPWLLRRATLLAGIDIATASGLEFGPLVVPLVWRHEGHVEYIDHVSTEELRRKYAADPNVEVADILTIDHVLEGGRLPGTLRNRSFDYVVATHVFEHLPNPLDWLLECADIMEPRGVLGLTIPDKRFTFDRMRPLTMLAEWVEAQLENRRRPSPRVAFETGMLSVPMPLAETWSRPPVAEELQAGEAGRLPHALALAQKAAREYVDIHCSVFTPRSCLSLLAEAADLDLHPFSLARFQDTAPGGYEFNLQLHLRGDQGPDERATSFREKADSTHPGSPHDPA
jgi:SAM-dependent methyltransferase